MRDPPTRGTRSVYFVTYVVYAELPIVGLSLSWEQDGVLYLASRVHIIKDLVLKLIVQALQT